VTKILLVEEDNDLRNNISKLLNLSGMSVEEAKDGNSGLSMATTNHYDLILCADNMEVVDGFTILEELKKNKRTDCVPFIFISNSLDIKLRRRGMNLGADDYITKPFSKDDLMQSITARFKKKANQNLSSSENLKLQIEELEQSLYFNSISGLPNEQALLKKLDEIKCGLVTMIYIAISGLLEIGEFISRNSIDNIEKEIASRITSCQYENAIFYHICSEEYFVLIADTKPVIKDDLVETIELFLKAIMDKISLPMGSSEYKLNFSAGIGVKTTLILNDEDILKCYGNVRTAKDYALEKGANCYYFYSQNLEDEYGLISRKNLSKYMTNEKNTRVIKQGREELNSKSFDVKVFFLNPHSIMQQDIIGEIVSNEYEAYILYDHIKALKIIKKYKNCLLFINIDSVLSEDEWIVYIKNISFNPETSGVRVGVLSLYDDLQKIEKFVMSLMVPCGYIRLKLGLKECKNILLNVLEANEAKGARRFVRANCKDLLSVFISVKFNNKLTKGFIYDISSVGMACGFRIDSELILQKGTILEDIQLQLKGSLCLLSGTVHGIHSDGEGNVRYVVMFDDIKDNDRSKIYAFISKCFQENIDKEMAALE